MSRNERSKVHKHAHRRTKAEQGRNPDQRVERTRERLGNAFVTLIHEKPIEDVTVQNVLDRAAVGRSTFYLHFRDKNDLLLSQLEKFLQIMSTQLLVYKEESNRVVPVAEFFTHIGTQRKLYQILADAGRLNDFLDLARRYFARGIKQRLKDSKHTSKLSRPELDARASALAGGLLSLLRWWLENDAKESPQAMDDLFHGMVWNGLQS